VQTIKGASRSMTGFFFVRSLNAMSMNLSRILCMVHVSRKVDAQNKKGSLFVR